ncbi:DNA-binding MarR family transcriptional regulator [Limimaricola soesokkakensis]|uniref:DNA-binding MarR family transcriptional regulator n=1 Tax=Limimaricola soesokkakensis TaxID=1343159 RepID=A0A1X6YCG0_9RHOB|nr:MarR family winged helix-turn-helix transcriptional regulator [Limimaricola soesokkakensis]PSK87084.1 DNA-binding MarR family transcriptional regulator [Limimaricola soesokkakensis]SLN16990.1 MarR family protein [Limimaricola soesokkakensis]
MAERDEELIGDMARAGIDPEVTRAALAFDAVLQRWRRRVRTRELGHRALSELGLPLDLAQLDVMIAIHAPANEFGDDPAEETMVSTVAQRLNIDPSRASRIVSDLIARGFAERAASQADARRTIVALTPSGLAIVEAVRRYKFLLLGGFLSDWTVEERETLLPLLERFSHWSETGATADEADLENRIGRLRDDLAQKLAAL